MADYDFDRIIDRRGTASLKYDFGKQRAGREDLLPMWVADMDFPLPKEILLEIQSRTAHGIFGYTEPDDTYYEILESWFERRYHWRIQREWNTVVPGVVYAIAAALRAMTEPGDAVLIQEPVYYPFRQMIEENKRVCVNNQLVEQEGHYEIDFEDFERKIVEKKIKVFLLCSPHNPVGRVWTAEELRKMADICLNHGVQVIADEIHCDFIYPGHSFVPFGALSDKYLEHAAICTSPSKTFNLAGLQVANILIPNPGLRRAFRRENSANGYSQCNTLGLTAAQAVYRMGEGWLSELLLYLQGNLSVFREFLKKELPEIRLIEPEGTYLLWTDCSGLFSNPAELYRFMRDKANLWLDDGVIFGKETALFERFNIACHRSVVLKALEQLKDAVSGR